MHPVERARRSRGLTQREFVELVGVHIDCVQTWERGSQPSSRHLAKIAEVLGVGAGDLLERLVADTTPSAIMPPDRDVTTDARDAR